jgi:hypothetical protein
MFHHDALQQAQGPDIISVAAVLLLLLLLLLLPRHFYALLRHSLPLKCT